MLYKETHFRDDANASIGKEAYHKLFLSRSRNYTQTQRRKMQRRDALTQSPNGGHNAPNWIKKWKGKQKKKEMKMRKDDVKGGRAAES